MAFQLGNLEDGDIKPVKPRVLADQLGIGDNAAEAIVKPNSFYQKTNHNSADKRGGHADHEPEAVAEPF